MVKKKNILKASPMWERINKQFFYKPSDIDLNTFKSNQSIFKLSLWDPKTNGVRYLKTLLYTVLSNSEAKDFHLYKRIENRNVGSPITVKIRGERVCLDYFQAVDEAKTISMAVSLKGAKILEIGAGYGRTCHTLLSLHPEIENYYLLDLEPCLVLSRRYLERVLSTNLFAKTRFFEIGDFNCLEQEIFDLAINIDSMADMQEESVSHYLGFIDDHCTGFYCKNPVGKYVNESLDGQAGDNESVELALKTGILRDIIDIYDENQIYTQVEKFLKAYCPGGAWKCISHRSAPPWSFYHQAVYRRSSANLFSRTATELSDKGKA